MLEFFPIRRRFPFEELAFFSLSIELVFQKTFQDAVDMCFLFSKVNKLGYHLDQGSPTLKVRDTLWELNHTKGYHFETTNFT